MENISINVYRKTGDLQNKKKVLLVFGNVFRRFGNGLHVIDSSISVSTGHPRALLLTHNV